MLVSVESQRVQPSVCVDPSSTTVTVDSRVSGMLSTSGAGTYGLVLSLGDARSVMAKRRKRKHCWCVVIRYTYITTGCLGDFD